MRLGKLMNTIKDFACAGEFKLRIYALSTSSALGQYGSRVLPSNHKQSRFYKISIRDDLQKLSMVLLTVNRNPCNPWAFQLMVYKCGL